MHSNMLSTKVLIIFSAFVVIIQADDIKEKDRAIFRECAEANGMKMEGHKRGEKPKGPPPSEMLCTIKCAMEKKGILSEGKIVIEEAKKDHALMRGLSPDEVDAAMECLKDIEVKECSDLAQVFACGKDMPM